MVQTYFATCGHNVQLPEKKNIETYQTIFLLRPEIHSIGKFNNSRNKIKAKRKVRYIYPLALKEIHNIILVL